MNQFIIRKLWIVLLFTVSCTPESDHDLEYYIRDSKAFLTKLIQNNISGSIEHFIIDDPSTADRLYDDLVLTRERLICYNDNDYTIDFERFHVQEHDEFNDNFPFYLRFSISCGGRKKFVNVYYHQEYKKIFFVRDFFREETL
ncbi:MAG: hypothetical protein ACNS60_02015 [Candidatus Cyclobacteriaceae bacterium M2_1C_046]